MSAISNYIKMNNSQLAEEINKQRRKISSAQETIALIKKLQIAGEAISRNRQAQDQRNAETADTIDPRSTDT